MLVILRAYLLVIVRASALTNGQLRLAVHTEWHVRPVKWNVSPHQKNEFNKT
jgi:hypothetical protein